MLIKNRIVFLTIKFLMKINHFLVILKIIIIKNKTNYLITKIKVSSDKIIVNNC